MISQFFILSPRGDTIIVRDYLKNIPRESIEIFFRKTRSWGNGKDAPPVFQVDGISYLHVKEPGLLIAATTRENVSPAVVLELLKRIGGVIKDYCGVLSEEAVRKNCVLVYELLDEVIDYGFPQNSSSEALKEFVLNQPILVKSHARGQSATLFGAGRGPSGVAKSVLDTTRTDGGRRDEIFVDVVERLTATFNSTGYLQSSQIDGAIVVKSYLAGNPSIRLALNDDLVIGRQGATGGGQGWAHGSSIDSVHLDDCNFHEAVSLDEFESNRMLQLTPPDGEFALMQYRSSYDSKPPITVYVELEDDPTSPNKVILDIQLHCSYGADKSASSLEVLIPLPPPVQRVSCTSPAGTPKLPPGQTWDWLEKQRRLVWKFSKAQGSARYSLKARLTLGEGGTRVLRRDIGPITLQFTIPMLCVSRLQVRYLQIMKADKNYQPYRWVRYVTTSNSYVIRV